MPKQTWYYLNALFLLVLLGAATAADAQVDQQRAQAFFKEAQALCERDGGRLWGVSVCGPMVIGDMRTKTFATSQPAAGRAAAASCRSRERTGQVGRRHLGRVRLGRPGQQNCAEPERSTAP